MEETGTDVQQKPSKENREKGIDVSKWQGEIDWSKVAESGVKHVCIKMTEGGSYLDPKFIENGKGAKKAGISVNCYHYFRASRSSPEKQMANIRESLSVTDFDFDKKILAIDVEEIGNDNATPDQVAKALDALLNLIKKDEVSSRPAMIYTSYGYWDETVEWDEYSFGDYPLWVAHWEKSSPTLPQPWKSEDKTWAWWQYSARGNVDGIAKPVDWSIW